MVVKVTIKDGLFTSVTGEDALEVSYILLLFGVHPPMEKKDRDAKWKDILSFLTTEPEEEE